MENEGAVKKRIKDLESQCAGERKRLDELKAMNSKLDSIKWRIDQALAEAERLN
jgi:predicted  nucleic acid-binding Zn-ribbon protein